MTLLDGLDARIDFAFLCDAAGGGADGKLQAKGIGVDTFTAERLPALLQLTLIVRASGTAFPACLVRVTDADDHTLASEPLRVRIAQPAGDRPAKFAVLAALLVPVGHPGEFRLDIEAGGRQLHSISFWVVR
jgi:hypothetical protein